MGKSAAMLLPALVMIVAQQQERAGELMKSYWLLLE